MAFSWITHNPFKKMEQISPSFGSSTCNAYNHGVSFIFLDVKGRRWSGEGCELVWRRKIKRIWLGEMTRKLKNVEQVAWDLENLDCHSVDKDGPPNNHEQIYGRTTTRLLLKKLLIWFTPFSMLRFLKMAGLIPKSISFSKARLNRYLLLAIPIEWLTWIYPTIIWNAAK